MGVGGAKNENRGAEVETLPLFLHWKPCCPLLLPLVAASQPADITSCLCLPGLMGGGG